MREIKFRAFDSRRKKMYSWAELGEMNERENLSLWNVLIGEVSHIKPLEFTGLKDKNGKEIYEGDVLDKKYKWEVYFDGGAFWVKNTSPFRDYLLSVIIKRKTAGIPVEIIGNIYEHKGLIDDINRTKAG